MKAPISLRAESEAELVDLVAAVEARSAPSVVLDEKRRSRAVSLLAQLGEQATPTAAFDSLVTAICAVEPSLHDRRPRFREAAARIAAEAHGAGATAKSLGRRARELTGAQRLAPPKFQRFRSADLKERCRRIEAVTTTRLEAKLFSGTACLVR